MVAFAENKTPTGGSSYNADAETQNYYVRNRYYAAHLGRWLTRDPIGYQGGINLYECVQSSPVGKADASGLGGGNPNLYPPPPPLSPQTQALLQQYSGRNAGNYPTNLPPPYDGVGGAVLGPLLAGGWHFTGATGREKVGYTGIHKVMVDGHCVKIGLPVYAPTAQVERGENPPAWFTHAVGMVVGTAAAAGTGLLTKNPVQSLAVGAAASEGATDAVDWALDGNSYQTKWIRVYGPTWVGTQPVVVP